MGLLPSPVPLPERVPATGRPRPQPRVVATATGLLALGAAWLTADHGPRQAALFLIGAGCGAVLYHAAFGFTAAYRALVTTGAGAGVRAQCLMLAVATVLFAPILASGMVLGAPVVGAVAPASVSVLVGAFVFAIGMQIGGGCGSGTLWHLGSGATALGFTLAGFVAGSVVATFHAPFWSALPSLGDVSLGEALGWPAATAAQLLALGGLAGLSLWIERRRGRPGAPDDDVHATAAALDGAAATNRTTPAVVLSRLVRGPWSLVAGALALAVLNALTLVVAGHPWTITWAFALWGAKLLDAIGYDLSEVPFWAGEFQQAALEAPVLADVTSVMDFGLILGALAAAGLAGRFGAARRVRGRVVVAAVAGGLLLGYGARIAYGCNIGALVSGIASTSLHGWLWAAAALAGTPLGVRLRRAFGM